MLFSLIKKIIKQIPIDFTQNQKYDRQTKQVLKTICKQNSNCIDIGCHKGEVLDIMLQYAPTGKHIGFEPIPLLSKNLALKYSSNKNISFYQIALSNVNELKTFNYVTTNPAYSGLQKRRYAHNKEHIEIIDVQTNLLDNILPNNWQVDIIKIDVEGGELQVLQGAIQTIKRCKPFIIFEHGLGASEFYNSTPELVFALLTDCGLQLNTMKRFLTSLPSFTAKEFADQFYKKENYYFMAYA
jgi:FkbM family methyltransferase